MLRPSRSGSVPARGPGVEQASPSAWLWLLVLIGASLGAEAQIGSVNMPPEVYGFLGANAMLPCHLQPLVRGMQVTQVVWYRGEASDRISVASIYAGKAIVTDPERMEFMASGPGTRLMNASLLLKSLQVQDENTYHCEFVTYPHGSHRDLKASTRLHVLVKPQDLVEALEVRGPPHPDPVPAARCVSAGGHPPANISWSLPLNWQVNTSQAPGPLPGTDTVTSLLLVVPSSEVDLKNVTCVVDHAGFPAPHLLPVTLSVHYAPEVSILGYDDNWYIGRSEVTLNCDIRSNPEPTGYEWSTTGGPLPSFVVSQGHQIFIPAVNESVNTTFFCNATNAIGTGHAALTVLVRDRPGEWSDPGINLVFIISTAVVIGILFIMAACYLIKTWRRQNRNPSTNGVI